MGDLIERDELLEKMPKDDKLLSYYVRRMIVDAPAVDAVPVVHGKWESKNRNMYGTVSGQCSTCGMYAGLWMRNMPYKYCPYCGAKMDGEGKTE